jgi:branched-chain amino acid transport system ATP-binding protein
MLLKTQDLVKNFGGLSAVDRVTLQVKEGQIFGLIGPNGAGKTTFLNCISGALKPTSGVVHFSGEETTGNNADIMCRKGMSRTFQIPMPFPKMTVIENVMVGSIFGCTERGASTARVRAREALNFVNFPAVEDTPVKSLNTVQLKRLDLARALACKPRILLLDEVSSGLTPRELDEMIELIRKINASGITVIVVEHIMRVIMGLCEWIVVLQYGQKIAEGSPTEISQNPEVITAYLGEKGLAF